MKLLSERPPDIDPDCPPDAIADDIGSEFEPDTLADEIALTIHFCLTQQGVDHQQMRVTVRPVSTTISGREVYAGFVRIVRWTPMVRALMVQIPWVERRIERRLRQNGILQYSQFGGLWFRAPAQLAGDPPRS